ncbi:MAG: hypothetical protein ACJ72K_04280 [Friedmanniella sp.]|jgi:hypothetical protein
MRGLSIEDNVGRRRPGAAASTLIDAGWTVKVIRNFFTMSAWKK